MSPMNLVCMIRIDRKEVGEICNICFTPRVIRNQKLPRNDVEIENQRAHVRVSFHTKS